MKWDQTKFEEGLEHHKWHSLSEYWSVVGREKREWEEKQRLLRKRKGDLDQIADVYMYSQRPKTMVRLYDPGPWLSEDIRALLSERGQLLSGPHNKCRGQNCRLLRTQYTYYTNASLAICILFNPEQNYFPLCDNCVTTLEKSWIRAKMMCARIRWQQKVRRIMNHVHLPGNGLAKVADFLSLDIGGWPSQCVFNETERGFLLLQS